MDSPKVRQSPPRFVSIRLPIEGGSSPAERNEVAMEVRGAVRILVRSKLGRYEGRGSEESARGEKEEDAPETNLMDESNNLLRGPDNVRVRGWVEEDVEVDD